MASGELGATVVDLVVTLMIATVVTSVAVPVTAAATDAARVRQAAGFIGARFRQARQEAINRGANVGVVFDRDAAGTWSMRVCRDGNGNGLRRVDILAGVDPCFDGPYPITRIFPVVDIAVEPGLRGPSGDPPDPDPVRFGSSRIASFSAIGTCTSGSLFLRSRAGVQYAVRVAGITGRIRLFRYDRPAGWKEQ
jgi:hypothetical protein